MTPTTTNPSLDAQHRTPMPDTAEILGSLPRFSFTIRSFDSGDGGDEACVAHAWGDVVGFKGKVRRTLLPATAFGPDRMTAEDRLRGFLQAEIDRAKAREANGQMAAERMRQRRATTNEDAA